MSNPYQSPQSSDSLQHSGWMPNWLATRPGRLMAFFFLYVTEGIPLGFTATAVATRMRRQGLDPAEIGVFIGLLYLPWSWKWVFSPMVELVYSNRLGRRRAWIVGMQLLMLAGLMVSMGVDYTAEMQLYTAVILVVNVFGATQDVAIDALACTTLSESERGLGNGLMFSGSYVGNAVGGAGVLFLSDWIGFQSAAWLAVGSIALITVFIAIPLREQISEEFSTGPRTFGELVESILNDVIKYIADAFRAFFSSRGALVAVIVALLPCGALSLSLVLGTTLAVEFGMSDTAIATLGLVTTILSALGCVGGGYLSDLLGRRKMLAVYVVLMCIPPALLGVYMQTEGYIMPVETAKGESPPRQEALITAFWIASVAFAIAQGLMYGTRTAMFMDVCSPIVPATHFTAYMSLLNLTIWYSSTWQGFSIKHLGYPVTLFLDSGLGLVCIALLPWVVPRVAAASEAGLPAEPPHSLNV